MTMNATADQLATEALNSASGLHAAIAAREAALADTQEASAHISTAVAERLLTARLPEASRSGHTLAAFWPQPETAAGAGPTQTAPPAAAAGAPGQMAPAGTTNRRHSQPTPQPVKSEGDAGHSPLTVGA